MPGTPGLKSSQMSGKKQDPKKMTLSESVSHWIQQTIPCLVCSIIIGFFVWMIDPNAPLEAGGADAAVSGYNSLVQGFREGHLYLKKEAPPGIIHLANPYDSAAIAPYLLTVNDLSYYKGKLYLYFGATPALVLFWPYSILTGHYLSDREAVSILFAIGFAAAFSLICSICRRYFPEINSWMLMGSVFILGMTLGFTLSGNVYEVPIVCGVTFTMLALAAIWFSLHARPKQQVFWLLLASLAYGLAVASRPSLLFGVIILLIPAAKAWHERDETNSRRHSVSLFAAAVAPVALIGLGLMFYNDLRFGNPFEFGWRYQLNGGYQTKLQQFSLRYLCFNFRFYFLEPFGWSGQFPFLLGIPLISYPMGYYPQKMGACGAIITIYPLILLILAAPLAWRNRPVASPLRWFVTAVFLLFVICALTLCLFVVAGSRYELDFLPALILLSGIGYLGLERFLSEFSVWRRVARSTWCLLLAYSLAFNGLLNVEAQALSHAFVGNLFRNHGDFELAISEYQEALSLWPQCEYAHSGLGSAYFKIGNLDEAVVEYQKALETNQRDEEAHRFFANTLLNMGEPGEAIDHLQYALKIDPGDIDAEYILAICLLKTGSGDKAIPHFEKALEIKPELSETFDARQNNDSAWSLATDPQASKRNGALAVKLAEGACKMTHYQKTITIGTLAAAYAGAGRFDDAISAAQKAIALAKQNGESELLQKNQELLALYLKHQPCRETQAQP